MSITFIPDLTDPAHQVLTNEQWLALGVSCVGFSLSACLVKPGLAYITNRAALAQYTGWTGDILLDVSELSFNQKGNLTLRSPYNGERITHSSDEIDNLLTQLAPTYIHTETNLGGKTYLYTNTPLKDAVNGVAYVAGDRLNIKDGLYEKAFTVLSEQCACPTCKSGYTIGYLHHIYQQVPLLGQRLLMQHNVFQVVSPSLRATPTA